MARRDEYYRRSKREGYRSRAAYKLKQIDEAVGVLDDGDTVLDLGAAPGGWLQVAAEETGGTVIGVDRQRIDPIDGVETVRGDVTDDGVLEAIRDRLDGAGVDVVLSDMAPEMTGEYGLDHARSAHLARRALSIAESLLVGGGSLVVKVFDGPDVEWLRGGMRRAFDRVRTVHPEASRSASAELYLVGTGYLTAPVRSGDEVDVEVVDVGAEGDGIARVEGFTLFVPGAGPGDRVRIRVDDVKPRFGFATVIDPGG